VSLDYLHRLRQTSCLLCGFCIELDDYDDKVECLWVKMRGKANKADILLGFSHR